MPFVGRLPPVAVAAFAVTTAALIFIRHRMSHSVSAARQRGLRLVAAAKSLEEQEILLSKARDLRLGDEHGGFEIFCDEQAIEESKFQTRTYLALLDTSWLGRSLLYSPRMPSTHDLVSENFHRLPLGTVCVADVQVKGRGRGKNVWESPPGCLLFSFTMQMEDGLKLPLLQYVISLAIAVAIRELCQIKGLPQLDVRIKWPNDIYLGGLKIGGILCTSTYQSKTFNICAGIGLNIDNEEPTTCLNAVLQEMDPTSQKIQREELLAIFFNKLEYFFEIFLKHGFQDLEDQYYKSWLHSGQKVILEEVHDGQPVKVELIIQGLTKSGYLLAVGEDGKSYELHPDGNSLDFFKGLLRRKMDG